MPGLMVRSGARLEAAGPIVAARCAVLAASAALCGHALSAEPWPSCTGDAATVLAQLNAVRAAGADCGPAGRLGPAGPLRWSAQLAAAADAHALDLSRSGTLAHRDADGRDGAHRIRATGYAFSRWAENLAAGHEALDQALQDWLASPGHCANLLQPDLREAGLACRGAPGQRRTWVLEMARPAGR